MLPRIRSRVIDVGVFLLKLSIPTTTNTIQNYWYRSINLLKLYLHATANMIQNYFCRSISVSSIADTFSRDIVSNVLIFMACQKTLCLPIMVHLFTLLCAAIDNYTCWPLYSQNLFQKPHLHSIQIHTSLFRNIPESLQYSILCSFTFRGSQSYSILCSFTFQGSQSYRILCSFKFWGSQSYSVLCSFLSVHFLCSFIFRGSQSYSMLCSFTLRESLPYSILCSFTFWGPLPYSMTGCT